MMSEEQQTRETKIEVKRHRNSPKHSKATWETVRKRYEGGDYKSLQELGDLYGINVNTLRTRVFNEKWAQKHQMVLNRVQTKIEEKVVDIGKEYLLNTFSRAKKYETLIDRSIEQTGGLVEPGDLDAYTRSEQRIHALALSALRLPATVQPVDIRSNGLSIGESIVTAIEKLRANPSTIVEVSSADVDRVLEMEVVDDPPK